MITLNCSDGKINIGGDFNAAKSFIRDCGARFDWDTKEWNVNESIKKFDPLNGFPFPVDVLSGGNGRMSSGDHVTRYGNSYTHNEWNAKIESEKVDLRARYADRYEALNGELLSRLRAVTPAADKIVGYMRRFDFDIEVECGRIQFSSPEREQAIRGIYDWYADEHYKINQEQDDAETAIKEQIYDKYGL